MPNKMARGWIVVVGGRREIRRYVEYKLGISNLFLANDSSDAENDNRVLGNFFSGDVGGGGGGGGGGGDRRGGTGYWITWIS
ncbi:hypothetical protein M0802_001040 [Mischocyttarus mexicanus]|nr:hypothetical protein M0802_001040 [Mischocyttarus mexicanus]